MRSYELRLRQTGRLIANRTAYRRSGLRPCNPIA